MTESKLFLIEEISHLKKERNAIIMAHYYQRPEVQEIADFVGDSLALSQKAEKTTADVIVLAGVHFMAETAKILNPSKKVLLPDLAAGCSLADSCSPKNFASFVEAHPGHVVISYINCSAEIKALSDIICTSSNAEKIIRSVPEDTPIIFAPDRNLGAYLKRKTGREIVVWDGECLVHEAFSVEKILEMHRRFPSAKIVAHPESEEHLLKIAHFIGSTSAMINYIHASHDSMFIVATEAGIMHELSKQAPGKLIIPAPTYEDNTCACSECAYMKLNTLDKIARCLKDLAPEIQVPEKLLSRALKPIQKMLEITN